MLYQGNPVDKYPGQHHRSGKPATKPAGPNTTKPAGPNNKEFQEARAKIRQLEQAARANSLDQADTEEAEPKHSDKLT